MGFAEVKTRDETSSLMKVVVRFNGVPENDIELHEYFQEIQKVYDYHVKFVILYDASALGLLNLTHIHKQAEFMRKHDDQTRELVIRCAIVLTSKMLRGALDLLFKLKAPACELQLFGTMAEAQDWLREVTSKQ